MYGRPAPRRKTQKGTTRGFEIGPSGGCFTDVAPTLDARCKDGFIRNQLAPGVFHLSGLGEYKEGFGTLRANGGDCGAGSETIVAFTCKDYGADAEEDLSPTLRAMGHADSHPNSGGQIAIADYRDQHTIGTLMASGAGMERAAGVYSESDFLIPEYVDMPDIARYVYSVLYGNNPDPYTVCMGSDPIFARDVAMPVTGRNGDPGVVAYQCQGSNVGEMGTLRVGNGNITGGVPFLPIGPLVRRLTPRECERLQGFPDDHTLVPVRVDRKGRVIMAKDGPRYKACGNSMAVPVMRWIGERIAIYEALYGISELVA